MYTIKKMYIKKKRLKVKPGDVIKETWYDDEYNTIIIYLVLKISKNYVLVKKLNNGKTIELYKAKHWLVTKDTYATRIKIPKLKAMLLYEI